MADTRVIAASIADEVRAAAAYARGAILVAPFITAAGMDVVLSALPADSSLTVFTRWRASEVAAGVSDPSIISSVRARGGRVFLNDSLHAKVYVFDDSLAFVGSANLTERGLGVGDRSNLETLAALRPPPTSLFVFLRHLACTSCEASEADARRIVEAAEQFPLVPAINDVRVQRAPAQVLGHFPQLRAPERLFQLYQSVAAAMTRDEREQALDDLRTLNIPDGLSAEAFREAVRTAIRGHPIVIGLDDYLLHPRRFGEVTDWLKARAEYRSHPASQRHAQTLIRWLLYFLPDRYRLGQPHYSEVLERVGSQPRPR
jgi:hypothetical protein